MKLKLIKELNEEFEVRFNLYKTKDNGDKITCLACSRSLEDGEKKYKEILQAMQDAETFSPEVIHEINIT